MFFEIFLSSVLSITWKQVLMYMVSCFLIWLAIKKEYEPTLLLPMGFGTILVNLPFSGVLNQILPGIGETHGIVEWLFEVGIGASEALPILLFIGIGAMIDFGPLLARPYLFLPGMAAQVGIIIALLIALFCGFDIKDAASIGIIGASDGPTAILVSQILGSKYVGAIAVAAYSYMALVPVIQPAVIRLTTTKKERAVCMSNTQKNVSGRVKIIFPIAVTFVVGLLAPASAGLVGFLMFGNLLKECGVLERLAGAARNELTNLITLLLGLTISFRMQAEDFVKPDTLMILLIGLLAFVFDTVGGILAVRLINLFMKEKLNPMIGAAGISAFPMSSRVVQKLALEENPHNILIMHAVGANVSGQIASGIVGGMLIQVIASWG